MAKRARKAQPTQQANGNPATATAPEESVAGYFRKVFKENPKLLKGKSNEELLRRWLADHPDHQEVPKKVKASLSNIKSVLRSKKRRRKAARWDEEPAVET